MLASPGVCKKRLLKAELCFVARLLSIVCQMYLMYDCAAFVIQYILVMEYVKFSKINDMYFSFDHFIVVVGGNPSR